MRPVIILFAKAPVAGRVKTRLIGPLTPAGAADLHRAFVQDMIERFQRVSGFDLELHTDTPTAEWTVTQAARRLQHEGDLGLKMLEALRIALGEGRPVAAIVGSDAPTLPARYVELLLRSTADVSLGPSEDGGYYAIAARRVHPEMFRNVEWSTGATLAQTAAAVRDCGLSVETGEPWFDIDTAADLERLRGEPDLPRHTLRALRERL